MTILRNFLRWFARRVLSLRYSVTVKGAESLRGIKGPLLVMPNHPGYIDPAIVITQIGRYCLLRPLVFEGTYRNPLLLPLMRLINALEVPDLQQASQEAKDQTSVILDRMEEGLKGGDCFLIYPSGRLQRGGVEVIGAARAVADVLTRCPDTKLVLVRTTGVWGSMFSFAQTGKIPDLNKCLSRGFKILLSNGIFFTPRRQVTLEVEVINARSFPGLTREQLNPRLEEWYNRNQHDAGPNLSKTVEATFVPYHFAFGPREFAFPALAKGFAVPLDKIKEETKLGVGQLLEQELKRLLTEEEKTPAFPLEKFGFDSLERMEVALAIEQRFGFRSTYVAATVGELWALAQGLIPQEEGPVLTVPLAWRKRLTHPSTQVLSIPGDTLLQALVKKALPNWRNAASADDTSGVLTYEMFVFRAKLLSEKIGGGDDSAVGILLPASVAADLLIFSLHFANKLPVILNWTTGPANLKHAAVTLKLKRVITSKRFMDRLGIQIEGVEFVYLEELAKKINKVQAGFKLIQLRLRKSKLLAQLPKQNPDDPAVVLFTSGSEKAPKAVPLTHRNLITDVLQGNAALGFQENDALLGFLPPFHSFGLTGNILLPILGGMPVVHHPDPTDALSLSRKISAYKATILFTTPTFLTYILNRSESGELESLRLIVTGAEKCPETTFALAEKLAPQAVILEGYGITECSPVISVGRPGKVKRGTIGQALEGVSTLVVDPESKKPLPVGQTGLLLVRGPTIFSGYLGEDAPNPFIEMEGHSWYNTGDLVQIDSDGLVTFAGRLKRFIKSGGEMISLPALEDALAKIYPSTEKGPQVAVEGIEIENGGRSIVLFSTFPITLSQANQILNAAGFRGIMRLDDVRFIPALPVLGTGKTDYKVLRAQILVGAA